MVPGPQDEALWYARALGWRVVPDADGTVGFDRFDAINAIDDSDAARERRDGSTDPAVILRWWGAEPRRAVRLATGGHFDVLDVPGAAGTRALRRAERLGLPLGPVAATASGRVQFFVAPGIAEDLPSLLDWLDWSDLGLDLRAFGAGDSVPAPSPWPATWLAPWPREWESARWLRPPAASRLRCAAGARAEVLMRVDVRFPDVTRLLSGLADACQQVRLLPRQRRREA